jgi:hypothetical protein
MDSRVCGTWQSSTAIVVAHRLPSSGKTSRILDQDGPELKWKVAGGHQEQRRHEGYDVACVAYPGALIGFLLLRHTTFTPVKMLLPV